MTPTELGLGIGLLFVACMAALAVGAAYRNGVTDGYGYSKEPSCPGYAKAGKFLREMMAHRWSELKETK